MGELYGMGAGLSFEGKRAWFCWCGGMDAGGSVRCSSAQVEYGFRQSTYTGPLGWSGKAEETGMAIMIEAHKEH